MKIKEEGLVLLRRSGDRQETSLEKQLSWAIRDAQTKNIPLNASLDDIDVMQEKGLSSYKAIRLDDVISGNEIDRPGLSALMADAKTHRWSHVFIFARDRIGRPDSPVDLMVKELELLRTGLTIVYPDKVVVLPLSGQLDVAEQIKMFFDYYVSGEMPRKLAEQMINTQLVLAKGGFSVGGNPPYGCVRALVDERTLKVQEYLTDGRRVRQSGCHVMWLFDPNDDGVSETSKLRVWMMMLVLKEQGWGFKRIANHLTSLKIPSPSAGKYRKDHGERHVIDGSWNHTTVKNLIENPLITAVFEYGRRSEGKHRRLGPSGPRFVEATDRNDKGKPKVIKNDSSLLIRCELPFEPKFDAERWNNIQADTQKRGVAQRGIPRAKDPTRYPLACRVIDLTDGCGSIMYGRTSGNRPLYTCGRYMKCGVAACNNNEVDGDAILSFTLSTLREMVDRLGARAVLRQKLLERAKQEVGTEESNATALHRNQLIARMEELERKKKCARESFSFAKDPELREETQKAFIHVKLELQNAESELAGLEARSKQSVNIKDEVDKAMAVLDQTDRLIKDPAGAPSFPSSSNRWA